MITFSPFPNIHGGFLGRDLSPHQRIGFPLSECFQLEQVHGDKIWVLQGGDDLKEKQGDAMICTLSDAKITIRTADCVPILIAHPEGVVAAVHAGWRGTMARILQKTLLKMKAEYALKLDKTFISIGPAICQDCYEIGEEVALLFRKEGWEKFLRNGENVKSYLDLKQANSFQAQEVGVSLPQIEIRKECTLCHTDKFYSYRGAIAQGQANTGRNYSWVGLVP